MIIERTKAMRRIGASLPVFTWFHMVSQHTRCHHLAIRTTACGNVGYVDYTGHADVSCMFYMYLLLKPCEFPALKGIGKISVREVILE